MAGTREFPLSNGGAALIDEDDWELIESFGRWYLSDQGYALKKTRVGGRNVSLRMHRLILNAPHRLFVDHINGNRLDNRRSNLRIVAHRVNIWNRTVPTAHRTYEDFPKGVSYDIQREMYVARKVIFKRFGTVEEAKEFVNNNVDKGGI